MASDSSKHSCCSRKEIEEMQQYLLDNPIDPAWDIECDSYDSNAPFSQWNARSCYKTLEKIGELPESVPKWEWWEQEQRNIIKRAKVYEKDHDLRWFADKYRKKQ